MRGLIPAASAPKSTEVLPTPVTNACDATLTPPGEEPAMERPSLASQSAHPANLHGTEGILAGTRIRTLEGDLPVEFIEPGDRIITCSGAIRVVAVSTSLRRFAPVVRLAASTIRHCQPEADLVLSPGQRVMIRDWRATSLYGAAAAAVPAARLADGKFVRHEILDLARLFTLHFASEEVIYAEGLELTCSEMVATSEPV